MSRASATAPAVPLPDAPTHLRWIGPAAAHTRGRFKTLLGAPFDDAAGGAYAVALGPDDAHDLEAVARAIPDARELDPGALVVVVGEIVEPPSLVARLQRAFGRGPVVARALRSSALLLRGYTRLGAAFDEASRVDVAWGYVP